VSGVTGGCGDTTLAINIAHEAAHTCAQPTTLAEPLAKLDVLGIGRA
jgi:hypothetical protein